MTILKALLFILYIPIGLYLLIFTLPIIIIGLLYSNLISTIILTIILTVTSTILNLKKGYKLPLILQIIGYICFIFSGYVGELLFLENNCEDLCRLEIFEYYYIFNGIGIAFILASIYIYLKNSINKSKILYNNQNTNADINTENKEIKN